MDAIIARLPSPLGPLTIAAAERGTLCGLAFDGSEAELCRHLRRHGTRLATGEPPRQVAAALHDYFAGNPAALSGVPVALHGTRFQKAVWQSLRAIAPGTTTSYGALAAALGRPGASRAVGLANGANPVALVVPCHRVVGADGRLTGFGGGLWRKRWLLRHEAAAADLFAPAAAAAQ